MRRFFTTLVVVALSASAFAQTPATPESKPAQMASTRPLPDIPTLMRDVLKHQKELDEIRKNYIYHEESRKEELDNDGKVKKTEVEDRETFYIGRRQVNRLLRKDGKDLTEDEKQKEQKRVDKEIAESKKKEEKREEHKKDDDDQIGVETFLRLARLSNPRREMRNGHEAIAFDFTGNPEAKSHGLAEGAVKKLSGTMWIDETNRQIIRLEAKFDDSVKVGGGLLASLQKGSSFVFEQAFVNNEVWLPTYAEATIGARLLLFKSMHQHDVSRYSDYRKFRSQTKITVADDGKPQ